MPSLADYEMDLRDLGAASEVEINETDKDAMFRIIVQDGSYVGISSLDHLEYDYEIQGAEIEDGSLVVYLDENVTRDVHVSKV